MQREFNTNISVTMKNLLPPIGDLKFNLISLIYYQNLKAAKTFFW